MKRKFMLGFTLFLAFVGTVFLIGIGVKQKKALEPYSGHNADVFEEKIEFTNSLLENGFTPTSAQEGLIWDCSKSSHMGRQIVTAQGENLLFVCDESGTAYFKLCENGTKISPLGEDDSCL